MPKKSGHDLDYWWKKANIDDTENPDRQAGDFVHFLEKKGVIKFTKKYNYYEVI